MNRWGMRPSIYSTSIHLHIISSSLIYIKKYIYYKVQINNGQYKMLLNIWIPFYQCSQYDMIFYITFLSQFNLIYFDFPGMGDVLCISIMPSSHKKFHFVFDCSYPAPRTNFQVDFLCQFSLIQIKD